MTRLMFLCLALFMIPVATAQDFTVHDSWLIEAEAGTITENGLGAPTVAYDPGTDTWVMYFETMYEGPGAAAPDCLAGRWGIGRATSPDGLTWTVDPDLVITPVPGTFFGCVVAHPTVIFDGSVWRLWFKAHQENTACADSGADPSWGCEAVTGVGMATSVDGINFAIGSDPIINQSSMGFPAVAKVDGVFHMLLAYSPNQNRLFQLYQSVSFDNGNSWSSPAFVLGPGYAKWVEDEIYNPSLICDENDIFPFILYAGGRDTVSTGTNTNLLSAGFGQAFSMDAVNWPWNASNPFFEWDLEADPPEKDWRHWDVVRVGGDHLVFFAEKDDANRNRIGMAYSFDTQQTSFAEAELSNRVCDLPDPPDTDGDGLDDEEEAFIGTDPEVADTDGDGLSDGDEVIFFSTNPLNPDTDGGGTSDGAEIALNTNPLVAADDPDITGDVDGDGLTDEQEIDLGTNPLEADTDADGISDYDEVITTGTDPTLADTDDDGLTDGVEINDWLTDPLVPDTDEGGVSDGEEVGNGTDPLDPDDDSPEHTDDTDDTDDTDTDDSPDTDPTRIVSARGGCGCASSTAPGSAAMLLLPLMLVGRRRR